MKPVYIFFFSAVFTFLSIGILNLANVDMPTWITSYVNDFLCMPVVLTICLKTVHFIKKDNAILLPILPIITLTSFYAIYFEWYLPQVENRYTSDWIDVLMYFCGALLFYSFQFISSKKKRPNRTLQY
ncbi:hypothetical protein [Gillisia limnaea]|uniref:Magnesium citrate secondary transporter n=1 Tax=Gillisia limnaea (strain DSM 15749 / LMG 21470 / R-8282) TaxID=865937 RepID=H2BUM1_GILLR|nr:hypothetical protein [Gillisia limnaea]EHQ01676.1 hypothetical protein Gilli_0991 [Gillisia limnaea DSM 15749]